MTASNLAALAVFYGVESSNGAEADARLLPAMRRGFRVLAAEPRLSHEHPMQDPPRPEVDLDLLYHFYYLYSVERAGMLWRVEQLGRISWYRVGAQWLLEVQHADGSWGLDYIWRGGPSDLQRRLPGVQLPVTDNRQVLTAFAVLFLKRAVPAPVVAVTTALDEADGPAVDHGQERHPR
jgi:hypothetical protein